MFTKLLASTLFRGIGGALLVALATWFGGSWIKNTLHDAKEYHTVKAELVQIKLDHQEELRLVQEEYEAKIAKKEESRLLAQTNAEEASERREHWRQSWYKLNGQFKDYQETTRDWIGGHYPDELDRLRNITDETQD